jgi:hypothetical protein
VTCPSPAWLVRPWLAGQVLVKIVCLLMRWLFGLTALLRYVILGSFEA